MSKAEMVNEYLEWRQEKVNKLRFGETEDLYSPESWIKETIMSEANDRINLIKDWLEADIDPVEFAVRVQSIIYDPLEKSKQDDE